MYFDFYSVNDWFYTQPISVQTVYKLYTSSDYDIHHRMIDSQKYILIYTLNGNGLLEVDGTQFSISTNDLVFASASKSLDYRCVGEEWNFWLFEFKAVGDLLLEPNHRYHIPFQKSYFSLCDQMLDCLKENKQKQASAFFSVLYYDLLDHLVTVSRQKIAFIIEKSIEYIKDNMKTFTVQGLSKYLNIPVRTLIYTFQKKTGSSPNQYFQRMRMEQSKEYLENTNISIAEISERLGFCNPAHFSSSFKKFYSLSPAKYRCEFYIKNSC